MSARLYLMLGYPGAGKTTTAGLLSEVTGAVRLSSDEFRFRMFEKPTFSQAEHDALYRTLDFITELLLGHGVSVIYDANLNHYEHRRDKYAICKRTQATPVLLWLQTPRELAKERAIHEDRARFALQDESLEVMFERITSVFEGPREGEAPISLDGTHVTQASLRQLLRAEQLL